MSRKVILVISCYTPLDRLLASVPTLWEGARQKTICHYQYSLKRLILKNSVKIIFVFVLSIQFHKMYSGNKRKMFDPMFPIAADAAATKIQALIRGKQARKEYATLKAFVAPSSSSMARLQYSPRIKGAIAPFGGRRELKYVDTVLQSSTAVYDTTGLATPINLLAVGDDNTSRDGRQVTIKSVQVQGQISNLDNSADLTTKCRTMLVWDNANNSASTTSAQLISALLTSANACAFPLVDNQNRFTILWDSQKTIGGFGIVATQTFSISPGCHDLRYYRKMNSVTQYSGTTAAIGSIQNGALWFVTIGDSAAGSGGRFLGQIRVRFTDN